MQIQKVIYSAIGCALCGMLVACTPGADKTLAMQPTAVATTTPSLAPMPTTEPTPSVGPDTLSPTLAIPDASTPTPLAHATNRATIAEQLRLAEQTDSLLLVLAEKSTATVTLYQKEQGMWETVFSVDGYVGKNGIGKTREGDQKTPEGVYGLTQAFGVCANPGTALGYTQVDESHYWVDDAKSGFYNQMVSIQEVDKDWDSAEHLIDYPRAYAYAVALDYNAAATPNKGSAIFIHCTTGRATAGCIAIPQKQMLTLLHACSPQTKVLITTQSGLAQYKKGG